MPVIVCNALRVRKIPVLMKKQSLYVFIGIALVFFAYKHFLTAEQNFYLKK